MTALPPINKIVLNVSGFGTDESERSGIMELHRRFRHDYISPTCDVQYRPRSANMKHVALRLNAEAARNAATILICHSWGWGDGGAEFEKHWSDCGRRIDLAVLIDPVPRPFRWLLPGNLFALTRWGVCRPQARKVVTAVQVNNSPYGRWVDVPESTQIERRVYGSQAKLDRHAGRWTREERHHAPQMRHESIDSDAGVVEWVTGYVRSFMEALNGCPAR